MEPGSESSRDDEDEKYPYGAMGEVLGEGLVHGGDPQAFRLMEEEMDEAFRPEVVAFSLQDTMNVNRESLERRLMCRRSVTELVNQGIYPSLKQPQAYAEQSKHLERAKTGDILRHKLSQRPPKDSLVKNHILDDTNIDRSLQEKTRKLKRSRLTDNLNEHLSCRPGPLELVTKNILQVDPSVKESIIEGKIQFSRTSDVSDASRQPLHYNTATTAAGLAYPSSAAAVDNESPLNKLEESFESVGDLSPSDFTDLLDNSPSSLYAGLGGSPDDLASFADILSPMSLIANTPLCSADLIRADVTSVLTSGITSMPHSDVVLPGQLQTTPKSSVTKLEPSGVIKSPPTPPDITRLVTQQLNAKKSPPAQSGLKIPPAPDISRLQQQTSNRVHPYATGNTMTFQHSLSPANKISPAIQSGIEALTSQLVQSGGTVLTRSESGGVSRSRAKKLKSRTGGKLNMLKFHEYKPPGHQKGEGAKNNVNNNMTDTPYHIMLEQQKLLLQCQLELQQHNGSFVIPQSLPQVRTSGEGQVTRSTSKSSPATATPTQNILKQTWNVASSTVDTKPPAVISPPVVTMTPALKLESLKVAELKSHCRRFSLPCSGTKPNLIERLIPLVDKIFTSESVASNSETSAASSPLSAAASPHSVEMKAEPLSPTILMSVGGQLTTTFGVNNTNQQQGIAVVKPDPGVMQTSRPASIIPMDVESGGILPGDEGMQYIMSRSQSFGSNAGRLAQVQLMKREGGSALQQSRQQVENLRPPGVITSQVSENCLPVYTAVSTDTLDQGSKAANTAAATAALNVRTAALLQAQSLPDVHTSLLNATNVKHDNNIMSNNNNMPQQITLPLSNSAVQHSSNTIQSSNSATPQTFTIQHGALQQGSVVQGMGQAAQGTAQAQALPGTAQAAVPGITPQQIVLRQKQHIQELERHLKESQEELIRAKLQLKINAAVRGGTNAGWGGASSDVGEARGGVIMSNGSVIGQNNVTDNCGNVASQAGLNQTLQFKDNSMHSTGGGSGSNIRVLILPTSQSGHVMTQSGHVMMSNQLMNRTSSSSTQPDQSIHSSVSSNNMDDIFDILVKSGEMSPNIMLENSAPSFEAKPDKSSTGFQLNFTPSQFITPTPQPLPSSLSSLPLQSGQQVGFGSLSMSAGSLTGFNGSLINGSALANSLGSISIPGSSRTGDVLMSSANVPSVRFDSGVGLDGEGMSSGELGGGLGDDMDWSNFDVALSPQLNMMLEDDIDLIGSSNQLTNDRVAMTSCDIHSVQSNSGFTDTSEWLDILGNVPGFDAQREIMNGGGFHNTLSQQPQHIDVIDLLNAQEFSNSNDTMMMYDKLVDASSPSSDHRH